MGRRKGDLRCADCMTHSDRIRGSAASVEARAAKTARSDARVLVVAMALRGAGLSYRRIAGALTGAGFRTSWGGPWHPAAVGRLFQRITREESP